MPLHKSKCCAVTCFGMCACTNVKVEFDEPQRVRRGQKATCNGICLYLIGDYKKPKSVAHKKFAPGVVALAIDFHLPCP